PCRSSAASPRSSSARERDAVLGLPDKPTTGADTVPPPKSDRPRLEAESRPIMVRRVGAGPPTFLAHVIPHADAPDRPLSVQQMERQAWQHISMVADFIAWKPRRASGLVQPRHPGSSRTPCRCVGTVLILRTVRCP